MATAASIIPADATPFVQGFPSASTRIIYGQWVYPDNTGIVDPPTIEYVGAPYYLLAAGATLFTKKITATMATAVDDSTRGVWFAEVLVYDDADIVGDVAVKISHALIPNGITLAIPKGDGTPLNIANALAVTGSTGGLLVVTVGGGGSGSTTPGDGTVTDAKITSGRALVGSAAALELIQDIIGSTLAGGTYDDAGGTYSLPVGGSGTPGASSITSAMLIDGTVGTSDLADGSITDAKVAVGRALLGSSAAAEYVQDIVGAMSSGWTYDDPSGTITLPSAGATPAIADAVHMLASSLTDFTSGASTATKIAAITANDAAIAAALVSAGGKRVIIPPCPTNTRGWPASVVLDEQLGTYMNAGGTQTAFTAGLNYAISGPLRTVPGSLAANGDPQDSTHLAAGPALTITRKAGNVFVPVNLRNNFQLGPNNPSSGSVFTVVCTGFELSSGYSTHAADELISLVSKNNYGTSQRAGYGDGTAGTGVYKGTYLMVAGICLNLNSLSYTALNTAIGGGTLTSVERRVVTNNAGTVTALVQGDIAGAPQIVVNSMSGDFVVGENVRDQATNAILGTFASATLFTYGTLDTAYDDTPQMRVVPKSSVDLTGLVVDTDGDVDQVISSFNRPDAVYLCGVNNLNTGGMRIKAGYAAGLVLRSVWDFYGDVHVTGLANHAIETAAAERAYGYGVRFLGHCQNGAVRVFARRLRHSVTNNEIRGSWNLNNRTGLTTGSVDLCTNFWNHGQGLCDAVIMGDAHEMLGTAWDMHEGMWNVVFLGVTVRNGNSAARSTTSHDGITLRGGNITVIDPDFRGVRIGVNDQSGPLDFDGRTSTNRIIGGVIEAQLYAWAMTEDVYKEELNRYRLDGVTLRADPNVPSSAVMGQSGMFIRRGNVVDRNCVFEGFNDRAVRHTSYVDTTSAYALGSNATGHATHINPFFDWSDADASRIYSQEATWASIRVSVADALVNPVSGTQKPLAWFTQQSGNSNIFYRGLTGHPLTGTAVPALNNLAGGGSGSPTYTAIAALGDASGSAAVLPIYLSIDADVTTMPTAGTTVSDLAALQTTVPVGSYDLEALLLTSYSVTGGGALRFGVGGAGAAGASVGGLFGDQATSATARNMAILTVLSSAGATGVPTVGVANTFGNSPGTAAVTLPQTIKGKLTVTTAGVLGIIWQLTNGATAVPTLKAGSYLKLTKVA